MDNREALEIADELDAMADRITRYSNSTGDGLCTRAAQLLRELSRSQDAPRCQCCGYLVTESEHRGCLRSAERSQDVARVAEPSVFEWLETEVTAIDCWHRGDPSYEHDAHWMKDKVLKLIGEAREAFIDPQPPQAGASDELASMTRMFNAACADLGAINEALGLDPDDGGAEPILDAIAELKAERDKWVDANYAAPAAPDVAPEGCTPADAAMLRAANHELAAENDYLRRRLRPFAQLASSPLSWAMVEYCIEGDPEKQTLQAAQMQRAFNRAADALREDVPSGEPIDIASLNLPEWVANAKPPATPAPAEPKGEPEEKKEAATYRHLLGVAKALGYPSVGDALNSLNALIKRFAAPTPAAAQDWADGRLTIHPDFQDDYALFESVWAMQMPTNEMKSLCFYYFRRGAEKARAAASPVSGAANIRHWRNRIIKAMRAPSRGDFTIALDVILKEMTEEIERIDRAGEKS
jgi:hypothetical protein